MRSTFIFIIFLFSTLLSAQKTDFYAKTDARKVLEGSYLHVEFVLENATAANFKAPDFKNFKLVSGPSRTNSSSNVNGYRTRSYSFGYGLQALKAGTYKIGSATTVVNGKKLKTQPITIEVVKASGNKLDVDKQVFVTLEVSDSTVQTGQQILVSYKLYTVFDVRNMGLNKDLNYDGFFAEEIELRRSRFKREIIDGIDYDTKIIYKTSLFPQQTGTYTIEPLDLNVQIDPNPNNRRKQHSIFSNRRTVSKRILSNGVTIKVSPLPQPIPESFSGAVGKYQMDAQLRKNSITTDDAIIINMVVRGNGDAKTVTAPKFELPEDLEMYDPNVLNDDIKLTHDGWIHDKSFEYLVVANKPGRYKLNPSFTYFDSDSSEYVTLSKNLTVNVVQGSGKAPQVNTDKFAELNDIYSSTVLKPVSSSIYNSILHWLFLGLLLSASLAMVLYKRYLDKSGKTDPDFIRKDQAFKIAEARLLKAKSHLDAQDQSKFYEEITYSLKNYLSDKFNIPALHLTKPELLKQLASKNIQPKIVAEIQDLFGRSEMALYAPGSNSDMMEVYDKSVHLISELEK